MAHFILVHGFNDSSAGADNVDKLTPGLEALGHTVDKDGEDYGHYSIFKVRFARFSVVARIASATRSALRQHKDVVVVGYSNGANYGIKALKHIAGVSVVKFVGIHPALPAKFDVPLSISKALICYTKSDWVVKLASYVRWLVPGWGRAGAIGYKGTDPRVRSTDYSDVGRGHGGLFKSHSLDIIVEDLNTFAEEPV